MFFSITFSHSEYITGFHKRKQKKKKDNAKARLAEQKMKDKEAARERRVAKRELLHMKVPKNHPDLSKQLKRLQRFSKTDLQTHVPSPSRPKAPSTEGEAQEGEVRETVTEMVSERFGAVTARVEID